MRTAYDKTGKPRVFKQDIDAQHAIQAGKLFETPPRGIKTAEKQKVNKDNMTPQQLVSYAKTEFDVDLDPLMRVDMLINVIEDLENPKQLDKPKEKEKKTIRKRINIK